LAARRDATTESLQTASTCLDTDKDKESESEDTDGHSETQELETLPVKKKKKVYRQAFKQEWLKKFSWLKLLENGDKLCVTCNKTLEGGLSHLLRHAKKNRHKKEIAENCESSKY
ncbi:hypothetical protein NQ315_014265, partial [Exocentrus adspersus]